MLISIVVPAYNRGEFLYETLKSCLDQNFDDFEVIIVDDGSTDKTKQVVEPFLSSKVRYYYKDHSGASETRNLGLEMAKGDYILWLGSDDCLMSNVLADYARYTRNHPNVDVFFGKLLFFNSTMTHALVMTDTPNLDQGREARISRCFQSNFIFDGGSLVRKSLYESEGGYDPFFKRAQDYEFWSRVVGTVDLLFIPLFVQKIRVHKKNLSSWKFDINYEIEVKKKMLDQYSPQQLFPTVNQHTKPRAYNAQCAWVRGYIMTQWGGFAEAELAYQESLRLNNIAIVYLALGEVQVLLEKYSEAKASFEKAVELNPDGVVAKHYLNNFHSLELSSKEHFYRFIMSKKSLFSSKQNEIDAYTLFGITKETTKDKRVLDLGIVLNRDKGWADNAETRSVLDPLMSLYAPLFDESVQLVESPFSELTLNTGSQELITCINVLNHVEDPRKVMDDCGKLLVARGLLLLEFDINLPQIYGPYPANDLHLDILHNSNFEILDQTVVPKQPKMLDLDIDKALIDPNRLYAKVYAVLRKKVS